MKDKYSGVYQDSKDPTKYVLRMCITVNGQTHRDTATVHANSKKKAYDMKIKLMDELRQRYESGKKKELGMTFGELVEKWKQIKHNKYSPTTYNEYLKMLDGHILEYFKSIPISNITKGTIYEYKDYKEQNSSLSDKTIRNQIMLVSTILSFAEEREYIIMNPCLRLKLDKDDIKIKPRYFSEQQMINMINLANKMVENKKDSFDSSIRYRKLSDEERNKVEHIRLIEILAKRLFVNLSIVTGSRRGEVLGLCWSNIHFDEKPFIEFRGTAYTEVGQGTKIDDTLKNGDESKIVYINNNIVTLLREYRVLQNQVIKEQGWKNLGYVFITYRKGRTEAAGQLARPNTYTHWFKVWIKKNKAELGLSDEDAELCHVHTMRHSYVSYNLNNGTSLAVTAELAGHRDKTVTANTYGHGYKDAKVEAAKLFDKLYA